MGFYYYNARWYAPNLGRFITEDPIKDGTNWYIYCNNNPLNMIDPTGLWTFSLGVSLQGGVLGGGQVGAGIAVSYSKEGGFQLGGYASIGAGTIGPASASANVDISVSGNKEIKDLGGKSIEVGGSGGEGVGGGYTYNKPVTSFDKGSEPSEAKGVHTVSGQITGNAALYEGHSFLNGTKAGTLLQIGGETDSGLIKLSSAKDSAGAQSEESTTKNVEIQKDSSGEVSGL